MSDELDINPGDFYFVGPTPAFPKSPATFILVLDKMFDFTSETVFRCAIVRDDTVSVINLSIHNLKWMTIPSNREMVLLGTEHTVDTP